MANYGRGRANDDRFWNREDDSNQWRNEDRFGGYGSDRGQGGDWRRGQGAEGRTSDWNRNVAYGGGREDRNDFEGSRNYGGETRGGGYGRDYNHDYTDTRANSSAGAFGYYRGDDYRNQGNWGRDQQSYGNEYRGNRGGSGGGRDFWDRASDEVSSWFGDDGAERRRTRDAQQGDSGAQHHVGRGPKGYTRSDDRIREDVSDRLSDDRWVDASDIEVTVANREVTLSGTVDSRDVKRRAEDIAESVSGVTHVSNNLRVKSQGVAGSGSTSTAGSTSDASTSASMLNWRTF